MFRHLCLGKVSLGHDRETYKFSAAFVTLTDFASCPRTWTWSLQRAPTTVLKIRTSQYFEVVFEQFTIQFSLHLSRCSVFITCHDIYLQPQRSVLTIQEKCALNLYKAKIRHLKCYRKYYTNTHLCLINGPDLNYMRECRCNAMHF